MDKNHELFLLATRLESMAQTGKTYCQDSFCQERYEILHKIAAKLYGVLSGVHAEKIHSLLIKEVGYPTPKIDVRGAMFDGNKILLVKERQDQCWTLPGGWADLNDSPSVAIVREFIEETGRKVKTVKLVALFDKLKHQHPPQIPHTYKIFFLCQAVDSNADCDPHFSSIEISAVDYFDVDHLPPLSLDRVTTQQIQTCFRHYQHRDLPTEYD